MKRIGLGATGILLLSLVLIGPWASWVETSAPLAWTIDSPMRIVTQFAPQERLDVSFRLHNTGRIPLRILGASAC